MPPQYGGCRRLLVDPCPRAIYHGHRAMSGAARHRTPRTVPAATALLDRFATVDGQIAAIEAGRQDETVKINAAADALLEPLVAERAVIVEKLEPWWTAARDELTGGKRKSIELGGCTIGTRAGRASLAFQDGNDDTALALLEAERWAKPLIRIRKSIDRTATLKALEGTHGKKLTGLGFIKMPGKEAFFVDRVVQGGTIAATVQSS